MTDIRPELLYTKEDEWLRVEGDEAIIGITDHAQDALSDIVFVELPNPGASFSAGETFGVVESVKAASDLYMPVSGEVVAINDALPNAPEVVNTDPYGSGWMVRVRLSDTGELDGLMDAKAYHAFRGQGS
ncbi:MAG: glycine cleavage system protein GcvH [Candidatus Promineifilaceae bacterium]